MFLVRRDVINVCFLRQYSLFTSSVFAHCVVAGNFERRFCTAGWWRLELSLDEIVCNALAWWIFSSQTPTVWPFFFTFSYLFIYSEADPSAQRSSYWLFLLEQADCVALKFAESERVGFCQPFWRYWRGCSFGRAVFSRPLVLLASNRTSGFALV